MDKFFRISLIVALFAPLTALAHEVYVLSPEAIRTALSVDSQNPFSAYIGNEYSFFFWGVVSFITLSTILFTTIFQIFEKQAGSFLSYLKHYAHPIVRLTVGMCLIGFGLSGNLFGTEISFGELFGSFSGAMQVALLAAGVASLAGVYTRYIAALMIGLYLYAALILGSYMLTYTDHLGAYILLFSLGGGLWSFDHMFGIGNLPPSLSRFAAAIKPYAFPILRILFGFGIMFAAVYAKFIHSELALQTILQYHLTDYFPFDPLFVVLGALIVEFLAGAMLLFGIAVRWAGLFLIFWLTLSQLYFHELWWVHIILFGVSFAIFCHGYDRYSLEGYFLKRGDREPVF